MTQEGRGPLLEKEGVLAPPFPFGLSLQGIPGEAKQEQGILPMTYLIPACILWRMANGVRHSL